MARNRAADALAVNDFAAATTSLRQALQGLPQRLVSDGLVSEAAMLEAIATAKERRVAVVSYLVEHNVADAREIAISAAQEFGVPLMDLDADPARPRDRPAGEREDPAQAPRPAAGQARQAAVRGGVGPDEPALAGRGQVRDRLLRRGDRRRGGQARRARHARRSSRSTRPCPSSAHDDFEMDSLDVTAGEDAIAGRSRRRRRRRRCAHRPVHQQGDARRHQARGLGHPLRAL